MKFCRARNPSVLINQQDVTGYMTTGMSVNKANEGNESVL